MPLSRRWLSIVGAALALVLVAASIAQTAQVAPGNGPFDRTWARTDKPVKDYGVQRTWMWGPQANTALLYENYAESPGGQRVVQYFDKSRMEITNPAAFDDGVWYVSNGLLVVELMTGQMQVGDTTFEPRQPAQVNVAGDADDATGPTYATMAQVRTQPALDEEVFITARIDRAGTVTPYDQSAYDYQIKSAVYVPETDHTVAWPFWTFMTKQGLVYENGQYLTAPLFQNAFYATGFPVTEAYWASVKVAGTYRDVLMQCFERRCLTYTPTNPIEWTVEVGNVGQHYYQWRYPDGNPAPAPTSTVAPPTNTPTHVPPTATATPTQVPPTATATSPPQQNCHASYPDFCIPPPPPDLDCGDFWQTNFTVIGSDPHRLDNDNDGIGCES